MFNPENTAGYTSTELTILNDGWLAIVDAENLEDGFDGFDEYIEREKQFADEVSRRIDPPNRPG